jgi:PAS domain S-box-containing protein
MAIGWQSRTNRALRVHTNQERVPLLKTKIVEKERIEEAVRTADSGYRILIEEAADAIATTDEHGLLLEANKSFCRMFGYTEKELTGVDIAVLSDPAHLKAHPFRFDLLSEGKVILGERQMKKKDGTIFQTEEHVKMLGDRRILLVVRDVTARRQVENALRRSEDAVRITINTIPTMAWTFQPDGVVDFANQRWMDYAGEEAFKNPNGIIHPEDFSGVMEAWRIDKESGQFNEMEMRLKGINGQYRWFLVRIASERNEQGDIVKWYGVSIDIEDSKRAEDELRLAYQRLSYHVENTPLAIVEFDKDLYIKRWSSRAEDIFGWKVEEAVGKNLQDPDFQFIYGEDLAGLNKFTERLLEGVPEGSVNLTRNYTKDGKIIYCEWYNSVLRDEHGNLITILSLVHNVTGRKEAEQTLKHSYEEIRRLTEHLHNIREEERTYIAREIHDDLGGQLTVLKMDASWLKQKCSDAPKPVRERIKNLIDILNAMVKSVRRISSELRPSLLDNLGLVTAIEWHLKGFEKRSRIKTSFIKSEELEISDSIKNGLFRIFQESLTNVARHSQAKHVRVELLKNDSEIFLTIEDDGKGFEEEKAAKKKTLGILGMKERTAMMGGSYEITSEPGNGTTVTVVLPCSR